MTVRVQLGCWLLFGAVLSWGCSSSDSARVAGPSDDILNVAGIWRGTDRNFSATGGDCVGPAVQGDAALESVTLTISQSGRNLTGTYLFESSGATISFT